MNKLGALVLASMTTLSIVGCASRPVVVASSALWPFEQLTIRTTVGAVQGYLYKPQDTAVRLVVALQSSPCPTGEDRDEPTLSTNGVVWDQFKYDSLFFQFERPGGNNSKEGDAHSVVVVCERADRTANDWQEAIVDSLQAVRKREHLEGVPTTYLGIGKGAALAVNTALSDPESKSIVLMSATFDSKETQELAQTIAHTKSQKRPSILFLHGGSDERTSPDQIERVAANLSAQRIPTKLIVFDRVGADFGINSSDSYCFDLVAAKLSEYVRFDQRSDGRRMSVVCSAPGPSGAGDALRIERVQRL